MAQKRIEFISFEEFKKLYKACDRKELRLCMLLGFGSGLRISEIIGYKRKKKRKMDKTTRIVHWYHDRTEIPKLTKEMIDLQAHQIKLVDAKGNKWRSTVTSPILTEKMLDLLPIEIPRRTLQYQFTALAKKVLNKRMSFHILRHGFGNYQANVLKVPLPIVQQMMGHSRLDTTGIYTKANPTESINVAWQAMTGGTE